jgi:hypothetical protein
VFVLGGKNPSLLMHEEKTSKKEHPITTFGLKKSIRQSETTNDIIIIGLKKSIRNEF